MREPGKTSDAPVSTDAVRLAMGAVVVASASLLESSHASRLLDGIHHGIEEFDDPSSPVGPECRAELRRLLALFQEARHLVMVDFQEQTSELH